MNCSRDLKIFANSCSSHLKFLKFFLITRTFFPTVGQNNFGSKVPFLSLEKFSSNWKSVCTAWPKLCQDSIKIRNIANARGLNGMIEGTRLEYAICLTLILKSAQARCGRPIRDP